MLWFIYTAYLFLRAFVMGSDSVRTFASVYGIVGTAAIPFVYKAVDLAKGSTMHPSNPIGDLPAGMLATWIVGMASFLLVFAYLTLKRWQVAHLEARLLDADRTGAAP